MFFQSYNVKCTATFFSVHSVYMNLFAVVNGLKCMYILFKVFAKCRQLEHFCACMVNCLVGRRYMQIRYQFISDLDMIIVDKTLGGPNLPMSSLYGRFLLCNLADHLHRSLCMLSKYTQPFNSPMSLTTRVRM